MATITYSPVQWQGGSWWLVGWQTKTRPYTAVFWLNQSPVHRLPITIHRLLLTIKPA
ncbi:MAG: hypothetical protein KF770_32900 [Anaerolineae bacterium]|nr:hypothetical protein [Anaerolineae bacterium]